MFVAADEQGWTREIRLETEADLPVKPVDLPLRSPIVLVASGMTAREGYVLPPTIQGASPAMREVNEVQHKHSS